MSDNTDDEDRAVASEIVSYLFANPEAADTMEGARRWWLSGHPAPDTVERAMKLLVNQGMVEKYTLPEGTTVFRSGPSLGVSRQAKDK